MPAVDFRSSVIERSRQVPVVVDFWAPWCAPCRILGPVIERLAEDAGGRWELVKVDTEQQPELAQAFEVMGIPAVKLFHHGEVVAEFTGALPEEQIRSWLDANLPDPRADRLAEIVAGWEQRGAEIAPELEALIEQHPDLPAAKVRLAQAVAGTAPARARELLADVRVDADLSEPVTDVTALADLATWTDDAAPARLAARLSAARDAFRAHDLAATLEQLVEAAMIDRRYGDELARRAAVALFRLLGHDHALTREHHTRLAMALHS